MYATANNSLNPNPFITYRDPQTGRWLVVKAASQTANTTAPTAKKR